MDRKGVRVGVEVSVVEFILILCVVVLCSFVYFPI